MSRITSDGPLPAKGSVLGWMLLPYRRYATFDGRSGRREFLWYSVWLFLCYLLALAVMLGVVFAAEATAGIEERFGTIAFLILFGLVFLANFVPGLALTSRRFHDIGLPGWLTVFAVLTVVSFNIFGWIGYMIVMSLPPKKGENEYGPPVYGEDMADVFS